MLTVYVRHYLKPSGIDYFKGKWFPQVYAIMSQQPGFVSCSYQLDSPVCPFITLQFIDEKTFDQWADMPVHDELIRELDHHRSRDYYEAVRTDADCPNPSTLNWTTYQA